MDLKCGGLWGLLATWLLLFGQPGSALDLDLRDTGSIKSASRTVLDGMLKYYNGNKTGGIPGLLPDPYYWWESGAMFGQMVEYWYYTGDDSYNDMITQALLHQAGPNNDYMPENQTRTEGNDDQAFWAFAVLSAAELKFPDPPKGSPQWLELAQAVFNQQAGRWKVDSATCGGGLRWQIYPFNKGYNYKNTISNGGFFQLAARLARYTNNATYEEWADKVYDWMLQSPLVSDQWQVFDGTSIENGANCSTADQLQWTYNSGTFIAGSAYLYNHTNGTEKWRHRLEGFLNGSELFFPQDYGGLMMSEVACETNGLCNVDQRSFKAYLSRWLATTVQLAPWTRDRIMPKLQTSAKAAARACTGGADGTTCGRTWFQGKFDGAEGVGEQMSALSIIQATLIERVAPPVAVSSGGTSNGNPNAGNAKKTNPLDSAYTHPIEPADRAGAYILTVVLIVLMIGGAYFMVASDDSMGDYTEQHRVWPLHREEIRDSYKTYNEFEAHKEFEAYNGLPVHRENHYRGALRERHHREWPSYARSNTSWYEEDHDHLI